MDVQASENSKWHRSGFLSSLNRSFRVNNGKSRSVNSSPTECKTIERSLEMATSVSDENLVQNLQSKISINNSNISALSYLKSRVTMFVCAKHRNYLTDFNEIL